MTSAELVTVVIAVFSAALVQATSGFGFALLAVPLMTLNLSTKESVVIITLLGGGVTLFSAWHGRRHVRRPIAQRMVIGAYLGMPLGLWVFVVVNEDMLRGLLGVAVLAAVVLLAKRVSLAHAGKSLDLGAGFLSGVLNTSLSTNGPPLVFALQARHLPPDEFRGTMNTVFAYSNALSITLFLVAGKVTADGVITATIALPALFVGQLAGFSLRRHVAGERFRLLVLSLLALAAVIAVVGALR